MEIKVTGCHDCPFYIALEKMAVCVKEKKQIVEISSFFTTAFFCPLKQQSITVKLEKNEKP